MSKISVEQVPEFQDKFLQLLRAGHQEDVISPLAAGKIDDNIISILTEVADSVCIELT